MDTYSSRHIDLSRNHNFQLCYSQTTSFQYNNEKCFATIIATSKEPVLRTITYITARLSSINNITADNIAKNLYCGCCWRRTSQSTPTSPPHQENLSSYDKIHMTIYSSPAHPSAHPHPSYHLLLTLIDAPFICLRTQPK